MKRTSGFTLIELMIVVAIIGILVAIALPQYQAFVVRSKMAEPLAALAACKTNVAEYSATHAAYPVDVVAAGCSTDATRYLASMTVADGVITATSQATGALPSECIFTLTPPAGQPTNINVWTPSATGCDPKYVPSSFRP